MKIAQRLLLLAAALIACQFSVGTSRTAAADKEPASTAETTSADHGVPAKNAMLTVNSVNLAYGATASPVSLQVASRSGFTGTVTLSCAGLPVGITCSFNPSQPTITAAAQATTSLTISAVAVRSAGISLAKGAGAILFAPLYLLLFWRVRKDTRKLRKLVCALLLSVISLGCLTACGGSATKTTQPTSGTQTILVVPTSGSTTKSIPLTLNLQ